MMKFGLSLHFSHHFSRKIEGDSARRVLLILSKTYNCSKWLLEAVEDEHNRKLYMCNLSILAAKNIKQYSFGILFLGVFHFGLVHLGSTLG